MGKQGCGRCVAHRGWRIAVHCAEICAHRTLLVRQRVDQIGERRPVQVGSTQPIADQITLTRSLLPGELTRKQRQHIGTALAGGGRGTWAIAIVVAKEFGEVVGGRRGPFLQGAAHYLQPATPAETIFTDDFVGETKHQRTLGGIGRDQRRPRAEPLGEKQNFRPTTTRLLIVVYCDRRIADPQPRDLLVIVAAEILGDGCVGELARFENRFGGLAPRAGHAGSKNEARAGHRARFLYRTILHGFLLSGGRNTGADRRSSALRRREHRIEIRPGNRVSTLARRQAPVGLKELSRGD